MLRRTAIFLPAVLAVLLTFAAGPSRPRYVVAFYNLENLFDTINDPRTSDEDMLPLSDREWGTARYRAKLSALARVIADMAAENGFPAVIGVAEAENRAVLEELAAEPSIAAARYAVCHYDSPADPRGIDVAFLYRPDLFTIEGSRSFRASGDPGMRTRDYTAMWGRLGGERFFFLAAHWPSRREGVEFSAPWREACARRMRAIVDSVTAADPAVRVVITGDMNDNPSDRSVACVLGAAGRGRELRHAGLFNPFAAVKRSGGGSTRYDRRWNMYDNIIVSRNLVHSSVDSLHLLPAGGTKRRGAVFRRGYMLSRTGEPEPAFRGNGYAGGASDHLPVYVILGRE